MDGLQKSRKSAVRRRDAKKSSNLASGSPSGSPWGGPGRPGEAEQWPQERPKTAPRGAQQFFFASGTPPGRHQERSEALLAPTLGRHGAQKRPRGLRALIWCPSGPLGELIFFIFVVFSSLVSHSFRGMFLFVFACVLVFALCFLGSSKLEFWVWKPSIPEALGGRRGSRSDMN